jgi:hypothetical protein
MMAITTSSSIKVNALPPKDSSAEASNASP